MTKQPPLQAADKGAAYLRSAQNPDGGFESYSSQSAAPFTPSIIYQTIFSPALILSAISALNSQDATIVRQKTAKWLLAQKSPAWSFNYWAVSAPQRTNLPYPDDLDDTFCALIALYRHDPSLIDEECLGKVVKLLINTETKVGGPYRTWLAPSGAPAVWQDVDLAVNSNIAYFLKLVAQPLPNLTGLMDRTIVSSEFKSPYYPSAYPLIYYLARAYEGPLKQKLAQHILGLRHNGWWGTPLNTALCISALINLGEVKQCDDAIQRLQAAQQPDGSWPAEAFCIDPSIQQKKYYNGSPALTTALAAEALANYARLSVNMPKVSPGNVQTNADLRQRIADRARKEIELLEPSLRRPGLAMLDDMIQKDDGHEVILLPHLFNNSLAKPLPGKYQTTLDNLGLANLYGWMAYTVYDDFLDDEGDPKLLSAANVAQRYSLKHFGQALSNPSFQRLVEKTFDTIDGANARELARCRMAITGRHIVIGRLPSYAKTLDLADRSLGHTLTPMGVLAASGIDLGDQRATAVHRALRHYLVARQLHDDLHDWEQDLRTGLITYVVAAILRDMQVTPGKHTFTRLIPKMQRQMWHHTLPKICKVVSKHTMLARKEAKSSTLLTQSNIVTNLVDKIDEVTAKTLNEQSKAEKFLTSYSE